MTVTNTLNRYQYAGNGSTVSFAFPPVFIEPADLGVVLFNTATQAVVGSNLNGGGPNDYTVSGVQDPNTGEYLSGATVIFNTAPIAGYTVTIYRNEPITQEVIFSPNGPLPAETLNTALDKGIMIDQQLADEQARAITAPLEDPLGLSMILPSAAARAGAIAGYDTIGRPTAGSAGSLGILESLLGGTWNPSLAAISWVGSTAALRALGAPPSGTLVRRAGWYNAGDMPAKDYWYNTADSRPDDGGLVIEPSSAPATGRWNLSDEDPLDFRNWGADPLNVVDSTAALLAAAAAGHAVLIPAGTYLISGTHTIAADLVFEQDALLDLAAGASITITGAIVSPRTQIFTTGAGVVNLTGSGRTVYPEWWGAVANNSTPCAAACNAADAALAHAGGLIVLGPGDYLFEATWTVRHSSVQGAGFGCTQLLPQSNAVSPLLSWQQTQQDFRGLTFNSNAIANPTNVGIQIGSSTMLAGNGGGLDIWVFGFGTGLWVQQANAGVFRRWRIQNCATCILLGGIPGGTRVGDCIWQEIVLIPLVTSGYAIIIDSGAAAQYLHRIQTIGGYIGVLIQNSQATQRPDNIWFWDSNLDEGFSRSVSVQAGWMLAFYNTTLTGSTTGPGLAIEADAAGSNPTAIDGIQITGCLIGGNGGNGILWTSGRNLLTVGCLIHANGHTAPNTLAAVDVAPAAEGLCMFVGNMMGMAMSGESGFGNNLGQQSYAFNAMSGALTDAVSNQYGDGAPACIGRVMLVGNMMGGNDLGAVNNAAAPSGGHLLISDNITT